MRGFLLSVTTGVLAVAVSAAADAQPTDGQGNVGSTSYITLPFERSIYQPCWNCSPYLEPGELFFQSNPASVFNNATTMASARSASAAMTAAGIVPSSGAQRWEDTYAAAFPPGTFPNVPSGIAADAAALAGIGANGAPSMLSSDPAVVAWRNFIINHPQYSDVAFDGGTMPPEPTWYRAWGGSWGHLSPLQPLAQADCPPGMTSCTWGDSWAYRWGLTAALSGGYGIMLSDYTDSQPSRASTYQDFNAGIVANFAQATGLPVPAGNAATQSQWITANAIAAWNDFLSRGYGKYYQAIAARLGGATGKRGLVIDQCAVSPGNRRWMGTDQRILLQFIPPANYICMWDDHLMQTNASGPIAAPPVQELAGYVLASAREPLARNGANLESDDATFWPSITKFYPTLSAAAQTEVGYKLLKRLWLWSCWAHIADRDGKVRRAIAFASRTYWDLGSLAALAPLDGLIHTVVPTQPFGPAFYYSVAVERAYEQYEANHWSAWQYTSPTGYLNGGKMLEAFIDRGGGVGYYVSDAALGKIAKGQVNAPSAWIVIGDQGMMPASERNRLASIAPVVSSPSVLAALPNQPLTFTNGLTGFGFYDQNHRLVVVVTNPSTLPAATAITGTIRFSQLPATSYTATDLFAGTKTSIPVSSGRATMTLTVSRWDTQVFRLTAP